jgi:putative ABC transport system substrate-binding protein
VREGDPEAQARLAGIHQELRDRGWVEGRNLQLVYSWLRETGDDYIRAAELLKQAPDLIFTGATSAALFFQRETRTVPIVFVQVPDPVEAGLVASLPRPGGNITGFTSYEHTIGSKWLSLLKEAAPNVSKVAVMINPMVPAWSVVFSRMETVARSLGTQLVAAPINDGADIERAIEALAREANPGLIVLPGPQGSRNRAQIVALTAKYRMPAIFPYRYFVTSGAMMSYGIDTVYLHRQAASYADRILKGAKPSELPVQAPTKFELVINLQTAKALGFSLPPTLVARADEVIE